MTRIDDLVAWLAERSGIARNAHALDAGFSERVVRAALAAGRIDRIRRSWIATASCDPRRKAAASVGGRVSCVTAAAMHGLWAPEHGVHLAVDHGASRFEAAGATVHWARGPVPVAKHALVDGPVNVLFHVARCMPRADAMAIWESALRTHAVDAAVLQRVRWRSSAADELAQIAGELSDSGLESRFAQLMRDAGIPIRQQVRIDGRPVDALIGDALIAQLDGFAFHQAADRRRDIRADARLVLRGYTVLRFDYQQVFFDPGYVVETIQLAIAQQLHRAS